MIGAEPPDRRGHQCHSGNHDDRGEGAGQTVIPAANVSASANIAEVALDLRRRVCAGLNELMEPIEPGHG